MVGSFSAGVTSLNLLGTYFHGKHEIISMVILLNPWPAEPGYTLSLQTVYIQISWLLKKQTDLDLHCSHQVFECISTVWIKQSNWLEIRS